MRVVKLLIWDVLMVVLQNLPRHQNQEPCPAAYLPPSRLHQLHRPATSPIDIGWDWLFIVTETKRTWHTRMAQADSESGGRELRALG